jgi:hypothetical protein
VFALVQPVSHIVETQAPADALHPPAEHHHFPEASGDYLVVVIVILMAGWRWIIGLRSVG